LKRGKFQERKRKEKEEKTLKNYYKYIFINDYIGIF